MIEFLILTWLIGRWLRGSGVEAHERIGETMQEDVEGFAGCVATGCLCIVGFWVLVTLLHMIAYYLGCGPR